MNALKEENTRLMNKIVELGDTVTIEEEEEED